MKGTAGLAELLVMPRLGTVTDPDMLSAAGEGDGGRGERRETRAQSGLGGYLATKGRRGGCSEWTCRRDEERLVGCG